MMPFQKPRRSIVTPGIVLFVFSVGWGLLAWSDWHFGSVRVAREQDGISFLPQLIIFFVVSTLLAISIPFLPLGIRWPWRCVAAAIPGSYAMFFLFR